MKVSARKFEILSFGNRGSFTSLAVTRFETRMSVSRGLYLEVCIKRFVSKS